MQQKEDYHEKLDSQLGEWNAKIDLLAVELTRYTADATIEHEGRISSARRVRVALDM